MLQKIKNFITITICSVTFLVPAVAFSTTAIASAASCTGIDNNIEKGVSTAIPSDTGGGCGTVGSDSNNSSLASIAKTVVNIFSLLVGIVSVIMIIYGGFRYITSGGESGAVGNAKNTIIYAIIGLIIVALAQVIVHFVLNAAINNTVNTGS
jgi:uncharacterized membrane protein